MEFWRIHNKRLSDNKIDWQDFVANQWDWSEFAKEIQESEEKNGNSDKQGY